ncbi:MAG TPA: hypothetical protein PK340_00730 [Bacilli bacterium]|nr:hypothetical protein [Bacilli bacterium]
MKKASFPLLMIVALPLMACSSGPMYELAYTAVNKLQTLIENADTLFIRHAYYGDPPNESYGTLALLVYSTLNELEERVTSYFGYENEELYYLGLDAVRLYDYRTYYYELDNFKINEHFGFER